MTVRYLTRNDWGAGALDSGHRVPHAQFVGLVAHHTVMVMPDYDRDGFLHGDLDDVKRYMRQLQHVRPDLGPEVPYSFVVFEGARAGDCIVAEGRGWGVTGAHTAGYNSTRYGVALAGNSTTRAVTAGVLSGYRWVGRHLANSVRAVQTIGHRDTKATECPGKTLYAALGRIQPPFQEEDDMALTEAQERALALLPNIEQRSKAIFTLLTDQGDIGRRSKETTIGVRALLARDPEVAIDDDALVDLIAEAIPDELADQVVDRLAARLQRPFIAGLEQPAHVVAADTATYATFTENNDNEGETWRFYIPVAGNEVALARLAELVTLAVGADDGAYVLELEPLGEAEVDHRVETLADDTGYMAAHTKLVGQLDLSSIPATVSGDDLAYEHFYKGGIKDLMKAEA